MRKVKIGNLSFKEYAAKKPIAMEATGKFLSPREVAEAPVLSFGRGSEVQEQEAVQFPLALKRMKLEPNFTLGIVGVGEVTKAEVIEHLEAKTDFGEEVADAEFRYCKKLTEALSAGPPREPEKLPRPTARSKVPTRPTEWRWIPQNWWKKWWRYFRNCGLFCENTTDPVTRKATGYRIGKIHTAFAQRGFCVISLEGSRNVRSEFASYAKSRRVVYIGGVGHGSTTTFTGDGNRSLLQVGRYDPAEVRGKIIHLLSCQTAKELGPDVVRNGALAYAGYHRNFRFVLDQAGTPVNELELFWRSDSTFPLAMVLGKTAGAAHNATLRAYDYAIAQVPNTIAATWLTWDRECFCSPGTDPKYGSKTAKIRPMVHVPAGPFMELEEEIPVLAAH
jgi:hypothetical protein